MNGPSPLNFAGVPLPNAELNTFYKEVIVVTGGLQPYTYTITGGSLPPGLSMNSSGVVSGTPTALGSSSFIVTVADSQTPVQARNIASFTIAVVSQVTLPSAALPSATIGTAYNATIMASSGILPYTYALASGSAALPAGLTLNSNGTISGTPTGPVGTTSFIVQVTDFDTGMATQTFSITVAGKLTGSFAFSFNGYNSQGQAFYMAGSFVTDGAGNITSGVLDRNGNDSTGVMTEVPISPGSGASGLACPVPSGASGSIYCVNSNNLGTLTLASTLGTYQFQFSLSSTNDATFILADANHLNLWGSGVIKPQNLAGLSLAELKAGYSFGFFGVDAGGQRIAGAGTFTADGSGNLTSGLEDTNDNGTVKSQVSFTGKFLTLDTTTGRGTERLNVGSQSVDYAFYVVTGISQSGATGLGSIELVEIQTDAVSSGASLTLASVLSQRAAGVSGGGTFDDGSLTGVSVMELNAVSTVGGSPAPNVTLGLATFDGNGNISSFTTDENDGGTPCSGGGTICQSSYTGTYTVDPNGRVTVTGLGSTAPVWYLVAANQGFVVGTDSSVTSGSFEPQTGSPFFTISIVGDYYGGTITPVLPAVTNEVDSALATAPPPPGSGNGSLAVTYNSSGASGVMTNQMLTATYTVDSTGRAVLQDAKGNTVAVLYVVSSIPGSRKNVLINPGDNPRLTVAAH
jgi:Putative Ig domain